MEEIIQKVFSSVRPYLAYPQELRALLDKSGGTLEALAETLRKEASSLDEVRRTDIRIFLNELERWTKAEAGGV
jgi:hypothetical protein